MEGNVNGEAGVAHPRHLWAIEATTLFIVCSVVYGCSWFYDNLVTVGFPPVVVDIDPLVTGASQVTVLVNEIEGHDALSRLGNGGRSGVDGSRFHIVGDPEADVSGVGLGPGILHDFAGSIIKFPITIQVPLVADDDAFWVTRATTVEYYGHTSSANVRTIGIGYRR